MAQDGEQVVEGPYRIRGNEIVFDVGDSGPYACNARATYAWRLRDGQPTFTPVGRDSCEGRVLVLTSRSLARRP